MAKAEVKISGKFSAINGGVINPAHQCGDMERFLDKSVHVSAINGGVIITPAFRLGIGMLLLFLFAIFFIPISAYSQCEEKYHTHDEVGDRCWGGCHLHVYITDANVNLGSFFAGSAITLPAPDGDGNQLEFILVGDSRRRYDFSFEMDLTDDLSPGSAEITNWTWEKADRSTGGAYGTADNNRTQGYTSIQLYKPRGADHCNAYAKFRITAKRLVVSSNAGSGQLEFKITVSAAVNI